MRFRPDEANRLAADLPQPNRDFIAAFGQLEDEAGGVAAVANLGDAGGQIDLLNGNATLEIVVEKAVQIVTRASQAIGVFG